MSMVDVRALAEQGDATAQFSLGCCYGKGQGVKQDYTEAFMWYRLSAQQGNANAQANLGHLYDKGTGVSQDYAEAAKWYRLSAEQGNMGHGMGNVKEKRFILMIIYKIYGLFRHPRC